MVDPFRGGGFGSIGFGPFDTGGTDFGRYNIANDGDNVALTKKYSAQIAWANGTITDSAYIRALSDYRDYTEKGSRERIGAQNELDDAIYTIGRNKIVRNVNQASTTALRVAALRRLIAYDRRKLGTMVGDNEQARELRDRIADSEGQVREVRYSDLVRRFNANEISLSAMLRYARNAAGGSRGGPDHETWLGRVNEWQQRIDNETFAGLAQDYEHGRVKGGAIIDFLKGQLAGMDPSSPAYADMQRSIEDWGKRIKETARAEEDATMASRVGRGTVSVREYLAYLKGRVDDYPKGSSERRSAEDNWLNATFSYGEQNLTSRLAMGDATPQDMADFYRGYMATMNPSSARYLELQQRVSDLLVQGTSTLALFPDAKGGASGVGGAGFMSGGHWVSLTGAPGGTPVNGSGFASQFDGSAFASNNCGMASAAMLAWAATDGRIKVSGGDLRYYSGDRNQAGDEVGTTFDDITIAFKQVGLGLKQYHGIGFDQWKRRLLAGEGSLINGHYMDAPPNLRLTNGADFTHTMYVDRAVKRDGKVWFYVMDPLGRAGYNGQWWPEEAIKQYGWSNRPNAGGGTWFGDVAFAAGKGRSANYIRQDRQAPRFQAFDTDYDGNSTIGRGGGTNRKEAGKRRDWSKGKGAEAPTQWPQWQLPADKKATAGTAKAEVTDEMVDDFLAAVDRVKAPLLANPDQWGAQTRPGFEGNETEQRIRAKELLGAWGGDARLAAVAWFTGSVNPTTSSWDATQRFYANAVGKQLGYEPVTRGGQVTTPIPGAEQVPTGPNVLTPVPAPSPPGMVTTDRAGFDQRDDLPPETSRIAGLLLEELGIEPTPDMKRAVVAWLATEGKEIKGNNVLGLRTTGIADLPGQVARGDDGLAVFGSLEDGIKAAAGEIRGRYPQIIAAGRTGSPERLLVAIDRSGWVQGGYGGALVRSYNELPGQHPKIIGGLPGIVQAPHDLAALARLVPSVAELFDVDPRDPVQMAWLDTNISAAKDALEAGASQWTFLTPDGTEVPVDFSPTMVMDLTGTKAEYLRVIAKSNPTDTDALDRYRRANKDHMQSSVEVAHDAWENQIEALDMVRQAALGRMDYATYLNATYEMADATKQLLGLDPNGPLDPSIAPNREKLQAAGVLDDVIKLGNSLDPRDTGGDPSTLNPDGDRLLQAVANGYITPVADRTGRVTGVDVDENRAYIAWNDKGNGLELRTIDTHPDDFAPNPVPLADPNAQGVQVPAYVQERVQVTVGGWTGYAKPGSGQVQAVTLTSAGYREAEVPVQQQANIGSWLMTGQPGATPYDPFAGTFKSPPSGIGGPAPGTLTSPAKSRIITVATRDDQTVRTAGTLVPVSMIRLQNPQTGQMETWYSIQGSNEWLGGADSFGDKAPPQLVLGDGASIKNGRIVIDGETYSPDKHGSLARYTHWYGTRPEDGAKGSMGADGSRWRLRHGEYGMGGGVRFDTAPGTPTEAFLEGDIAFSGLLGQTDGDRSRREKEDIYRPGPLVPQGPGQPKSYIPPQSSTQALSGGVDFAKISQGLAEAGLFKGADLPMTAGSGAWSPTSSMKPPAATPFGVRLSSAVRAAADAATLAAKQVQAAAAQRAAEAEMARRIAAAQAAERQRAAQLEQIVTPTPKAPAPTQAPKQKPKPEQMGYDPIQTPAPVKPPAIPTPPPSKGPQSQGMY